jgi:hypothetical protein
MHKLAALASMFTATCLVAYSASQMSKASKAINSNCSWSCEPPVWSGKPSTRAPDRPPEDIRIPSEPRRDARPSEPGYKVFIRFLGDVDDLLDTIQDRASFEAVKPKLLARVRRHTADAKDHPNPGLTRLSKSAAKEWETATMRHAASLTRADKAVPGVFSYFQKEAGALFASD